MQPDISLQIYSAFHQWWFKSRTKNKFATPKWTAFQS